MACESTERRFEAFAAASIPWRRLSSKACYSGNVSCTHATGSRGAAAGERTGLTGGGNVSR
eukprot:5263454-Pleurochrysis_carterae.AAC.2